MSIRLKVIATTAFVVLPALAASASQGPGTSAGTATHLEQVLLIAAIVIAAGIGLAFRLTHR